MIRATTPTHSFELPFGKDYISKLIVTYDQDGNTVIEKRLEDVSFEGNTLLVNLTQEETNLFESEKMVCIQLRVLTVNGKSIPSQKIYKNVYDVLNDEVL